MKSKIQVFSSSKFVIFIILIALPSLSYSQKKSTIDSLTRLLGQTKDSNNIAIQKLLSWEYRNSDTSKAIFYGKQALEQAIKLNILYEQADILGRLGVYYRNQGHFSVAMDYYFKGLEISRKKGYSNLESLELNNIGDIYYRLGIYDQALFYVKKGLEISTRLKDEYNLSYIHHMLGLIYLNNSMLDSAYNSFNKSLSYREKLKLKAGIASSYLGIGAVHYNRNLFDSSYTYFSKAFEIFSQINDKVGLINSYKYFGGYYNQKQEYNKAIESYYKSIALMKGFGLPQVKKDAAEGLTYAYTKLNNYKEALKYYELSTKLKDSISNNIYIQKITRITENLKFEIKVKEKEIETEHKESLLKEKIGYQRSLIIIFVFAVVILISLAGLIIYLYRYKVQAYKILNQKKEEIDALNDTLTEANIEILAQKNEIELQRDELQQKSDQLAILNSAKDKLFSIIAHDLRSPITTLIGLIEHLKENFTDFNYQELWNMLNQANTVGHHTLRILDNLLEWAKSQVNQVTLKLEYLSLNQLAQETIDSLQPIANNKKLRIINNSLNHNVFADKNMLNTILRNLISNAIKFSNPNSDIIVSSEESAGFINISITDKGVGISKEVLDNLFSSKVNTPSFGTANEKGSGLGISICNEFVKKLNGKMSAISEIGRGTTISFTMPKYPTQQA